MRLPTPCQRLPTAPLSDPLIPPAVGNPRLDLAVLRARPAALALPDRL
jgi:hypothetical protein